MQRNGTQTSCNRCSVARMTAMPCFLGIDGGGSSLDWCCVDEHYAVLDRGTRGAVQPARQKLGVVAGVLADLLRAADEEWSPATVVIGLAGAGSSSVRSALMRELRDRDVVRDFVLCGDVEVAAAAAFGERPGVVAWSGTGSFAVACGDSGQLFRTGGRGSLLGDPASAFGIVVAAARRATRAFDGVDRPTSLGARLCAAMELERVTELGAALQGMMPGEVAAHAEVVVDASADGDPVAVELIETETAELAQLTRVAAERAGVDLESCQVGGGVLQRSAYVRSRFAAALGVEVSVVERDVAESAARLARCVHDGTMPMAGWVR